MAEETTVHEFWQPPAPQDDPDNISLKSDNDADDTSLQSLDIKVDIGASTAAPQEKEHPPPTKEYGARWTWDPAARDYVRFSEDGMKLFYTEYQRFGSNKALSRGSVDANTHINTYNNRSRRDSPEPRTGTIPSGERTPVPGIPLYQEPLGDAFQIVAKPKRFFCIGRIFKTVWFEPGGNNMPRVRADLADWSDKSLAFHGERPIARFRWFVVVRRRLHHSLCFSITTFGGAKTAHKTSRGRLTDFVVLYSSNVEPPRPYDEEGITRDPIAVIIEDDEQYISPIARLDCSRVYTVEDNLRVMKTGRVHPDSLKLLEEYYQESVS
ncbi:hypothetical protein C8A03DRAFT_42884 [Achaetomium macrosporum]|uniref:DUF6590 domain-containing protein n=1 Tax=Achaetomium macrosporum TaxID=79813 RepID=A0AAN7H818_9PEZI|nr:hypothetical protein C8A03DRAFT_42884 [Achaetomium macrosporum]